MTCKKKRKKTNKREPHPEVGGHVLPFQFPHGQIVMALLCEEILWNFTSKIWWFPYSIVHTMIIWKCSKVLVVPPKKTLTRLYFQKYLLIMKTTIATSRKAIQLDGNYLKKKFCSKFSWTKSNHTNRNLTPGTAFPYRAFKVFTEDTATGFVQAENESQSFCEPDHQEICWPSPARGRKVRK